jgi:FixJ family two-component response regulator
MSKRSLVSVVDDDESVRESLPDCSGNSEFAVLAFSSAEAFLASDACQRNELPDPRHRHARHVRP